MTKLLIAIQLIMSPLLIQAQNKEAYRIFDKDGQVSDYANMLQQALHAKYVFFGELHNNPIAHWLQYELSSDLVNNGPLTIGAEMFEADNQEPFTAYVQNQLSAKGLDSAARLWPNYKTDYAPLVNLAKAYHLDFIATNVPRRYAQMVAKSGLEALDSLSAEEKRWIAPLPITYDPELPCYKNMLTMMAGHGGPNLPKAQAIKDATMGWFIYRHTKPDTRFIHFNGSYHSERYEGIVWYLRRLSPGATIATITVVLQNDVSELEEEHKGKADFIIVVDENMTTTY